MAEAIGGRQRIHKLAKLSVFSEVRRSSFHRHSEGGNNNKKQNKTNGELYLQLSFLLASFYGGSVKGVLRGGGVRELVRTVVRGPVRRGVHGPGIRVLGSPLQF